ncbi:hypothetical protein JOB18_032509 [Solea senegalensis]|uniref:Uncharacterized protein n=1 Tax=Solea senegalensis TaxID=28829 RepID=A0AAV6SC41_SOLSE|nr:hypothetical protein JOB18_032509 [Solea senegalensis]
MEFFRSLVPTVISGEGSTDHWGALPRDTGPRLLRMKRLGLLAMGQTVEEDPVDPAMEVEPLNDSSKPARTNRAGFKGNIRHFRKVSFLHHAGGRGHNE